MRSLGSTNSLPICGSLVWRSISYVALTSSLGTPAVALRVNIANGRSQSENSKSPGLGPGFGLTLVLHSQKKRINDEKDYCPFFQQYGMPTLPSNVGGAEISRLYFYGR
jgi:hypothetical protein